MDGLEDVVAAETALSDVDGVNGRLIIRGFELEDLAGQVDFETAAQLLWRDLFTDPPATEEFQSRLACARVRVSQYVAPDPTLSHAADILRMLHGSTPAPAAATALDTYLVAIIDHGLNASTFAARVTASTHAGLTSAALSGLSALKGPLHGGAPGPVVQMLDAIGSADRARDWLKAALDRKERLMGFGHRIYRVRDPRADVLRRALRFLASESSVLPGRLALAEAVETAALELLKQRKPDRPLQTNVEFYTAVLLEALGFPADAFTCVFAMGRTAGWIAHAREQVLSGRLIRPRSRYVGPVPRAAA